MPPLNKILCFLLLLASSLVVAGEPIELNADLTEAPRRLFKASLRIPAKPGPLILHYPKWIQGEHQPSGPIGDLSGLKFSAGGKPIRWQRDDLELSDFHLMVPEGATSVEASLEYLVPGDKGGYGSGPAATANLAILNWYQLMLYPLESGQHVRDIAVQATLKLPPGWQAGTALPIESNRTELTRYKQVSLEKVLDSPVLCGRHFREIAIGPKEGPPHYLTLACDSEAGLKIDDQWLKGYGKLVEEAGVLFGTRHYQSYRFLVALTDQFGYNAIEHHESSDNRMAERFYLDDLRKKLAEVSMLPHEYCHSWNGKFRRPEGITTSNYQEPLKTRLLWVYEGLTEYYGFVLAVRSGLWAPERARENWAELADWAGNQKGRGWRPLEDTAAANYLYTARDEWSRRRRGVDFYGEGALLWLDVDTLIREKSKGTKSLDDFCRVFHGGGNGMPQVKPYTFQEVVNGLNDVLEHDWKSLFELRVQATGESVPLDGLTRSGWRVATTNEPNELRKATDEAAKSVNYTSSIGLLLSSEGKVIDIVPGSPADTAKIGPHMKVIAVNGRRFESQRLADAVKATSDGRTKLELLIENGDAFTTHVLDYSGGSRHPRLERVDGTPDLLAEIFKPRSGK